MTHPQKVCRWPQAEWCWYVRGKRCHPEDLDRLRNGFMKFYQAKCCILLSELEQSSISIQIGCWIAENIPVQKDLGILVEIKRSQFAAWKANCILGLKKNQNIVYSRPWRKCFSHSTSFLKCSKCSSHTMSLS